MMMIMHLYSIDRYIPVLVDGLFANTQHMRNFGRRNKFETHAGQRKGASGFGIRERDVTLHWSFLIMPWENV